MRLHPVVHDHLAHSRVRRVGPYSDQALQLQFLLHYHQLLLMNVV